MKEIMSDICRASCKDAKKVVDSVLNQLEALTLPDTEPANELKQKIPGLVMKLGKYLPDLTELDVMKKHTSMRSELELKHWLAELAKLLCEATDIVKMGKALAK